MNINFYNSKIRKNEVNKSLGVAIAKTCSLKEGSSIEDPILYMVYDTSLMSCNYVYIPDFGRYYFITGKEIDGKTLYITCHVDVLKTYSADIKASKGTATRSNIYNKNIPDSLAMEIPQNKIQYRKLSEALTGGTYICIIGG